jgi:hypothetical protein
MNYHVLVNDNYHYMDESERYELGSFASLEEAIKAARAMVDSFLSAEYHPGITADELYKQYMTFGEDPFIIAPEQNGVSFSAWEYAKGRCQELCSES